MKTRIVQIAVFITCITPLTPNASAGDLIFSDDFSSSHLDDRWQVYPAADYDEPKDIVLSDGWLILGEYGDTAVYLDLELKNFTLDFDFSMLSESYGIDFSVHPRYNHDENEWNESVIWLYLDKDVVNCYQGEWTLEDYGDYEVAPYKTYHFTVKCKSDDVKVWLDNQMVLSAPIYVKEGGILFETYGGATLGIDNVEVVK